MLLHAALLSPAKSVQRSPPSPPAKLPATGTACFSLSRPLLSSPHLDVFERRRMAEM